MSSIDLLIKNLSSLPGIGRKSAARIAYYLLKADTRFTDSLSKSITDARERVKNCTVCGNYTEEKLCSICSDERRDNSILCVVELPQDVAVIEATGVFQGGYHVLLGHLSPIEGVGPDQLNLSSLVERVKRNNVNEIVIATNPSVEGDTTALYIQKLFKELDLKITRLASGLPAGGDLEYTDRLTLTRSIQGRLPL